METEKKSPVSQEVKELVNEVKAFAKTHPTDVLCLVIEHNREFMQKDMHLVEDKGWKAVNQQIGRAVKDEIDGVNAYRESQPMSALLMSHTVFKDRALAE